MKRFPNAKATIDKVKANFKSQYKGVISESFLRAEAKTIDGNGIYGFDFRASKGDKRATEVLLNDNDLFVVMGIRFFLLNVLKSNPVISVPQTYPNPIVFDSEVDDAIVGTFDPTHLEAFYSNGALSYKKGDTTYIKALSLRDTRFVSQTQQSSLVNKSSTEISSPGMLVLNSPFKLAGSDLGETLISVPAPSQLKIQFSTVANITTTPREVVLGLQLEGVLFSGGNKIATATSDQMIEMV